jgi:hypothetical protein
MSYPQKSTRVDSRILLLPILAVCLSGCPKKSNADLRGHWAPSPDGKSYLIVDDDNGGACGPLAVDGKAWPHDIHRAGAIKPGIHALSCGRQQPGVQFEVPNGAIYHFEYWGP